MGNTENFFLNYEGNLKQMSLDKQEKWIMDSIVSTAGCVYNSFYIMNHVTKKMVYVSENSYIFGGYSSAEIMESGSAFFNEVIPQEELTVLTRVAKENLKVFNAFSKEKRGNLVCSYDFHLSGKGTSKILLNQKTVPLGIDDEGKVWISLCIVSLSPRKEFGHYVIYESAETVQETSHFYIKYDLKLQKWEEIPSFTLSRTEKDVLALSAQGFTMEEISQKICKSVDAVKWYKRKLFEKMKVGSITEAFALAIEQRLI